jgi:hypothetical protein
LLIQLIIAGAAVATAIFIYGTLRTSKLSLRQQSFADLEKEYRTPLMGGIIDSLWSMYKECHENIEEMIKRYKKDWERNRGSIGTLDDLNNNLHLQRRLISQFFHQMADLYLNKALPPKMIFRIWSNKDLDIIPEIIIPIEDEIRKKRGLNEDIKKHIIFKLYKASELYAGGMKAKPRNVDRFLKKGKKKKRFIS